MKPAKARASLDLDVRRLGVVRPFNALPREALQLLAFSCRRQAVKTGERLFGKDEPAEAAYFVLEGEILLRQGETHRRAGAGTLIGEAALMADTARPAEATAASDSILLVVTSEIFRRVLSEFPEGAEAIRRAAARRAHDLIARLDRLRSRVFAPARGA